METSSRSELNLGRSRQSAVTYWHAESMFELLIIILLTTFTEYLF